MSAESFDKAEAGLNSHYLAADKRAHWQRASEQTSADTNVNGRRPSRPTAQLAGQWQQVGAVAPPTKPAGRPGEVADTNRHQPLG